MAKRIPRQWLASVIPAGIRVQHLGKKKCPHNPSRRQILPRPNGNEAHPAIAACWPPLLSADVPSGSPPVPGRTHFRPQTLRRQVGAFSMPHPPLTSRELVDRLDARHEELIAKLDELNAQIEAALAEFGRSAGKAAAADQLENAA
jgi:hypothetical protein